MARTFRHDEDDEAPPREQRRASKYLRDARKASHYTPPPVTRATRTDASGVITRR